MASLSSRAVAAAKQHGHVLAVVILVGLQVSLRTSTVRPHWEGTIELIATVPEYFRVDHDWPVALATRWTGNRKREHVALDFTVLAPAVTGYYANSNHLGGSPTSMWRGSDRLAASETTRQCKAAYFWNVASPAIIVSLLVFAMGLTLVSSSGNWLGVSDATNATSSIIFAILIGLLLVCQIITLFVETSHDDCLFGKIQATFDFISNGNEDEDTGIVHTGSGGVSRGPSVGIASLGLVVWVVFMAISRAGAATPFAYKKASQ
jgi:amino acid transporter